MHTGQLNVVYIVDVNGDRLVIDTWHMPGTSAADLAELEPRQLEWLRPRRSFRGRYPAQTSLYSPGSETAADTIRRRPGPSPPCGQSC
jgi:hypothetical protein